MAFEFRLPDIGEGIHEGEIVKWFVKAGDTVKEDDILCEVQNDKAVVEIPSPVEGTVEEVLVGEGTVAVVGDVLIRFDAPGYEDLKLKGDSHAEEKTEAQVQATAESGQSVEKAPVKEEKAPEQAPEKAETVVDETKRVTKLNQYLPVEVIPYGANQLFKRFQADGFHPTWRLDQNGNPVRTDSANFLIDLHLPMIDNPRDLGDELIKMVGVVEHGLFTDVVNRVIIGTDSQTAKVIDVK